MKYGEFSLLKFKWPKSSTKKHKISIDNGLNKIHKRNVKLLNRIINEKDVKYEDGKKIKVKSYTIEEICKIAESTGISLSLEHLKKDVMKLSEKTAETYLDDISEDDKENENA